MNDDQIQEALGRFNAFFAEMWKQINARLVDPIPDPLDVFMCQTLRALAERQAALEKIAGLKRQYAVGQTTGERAREIARRFTGGE